MLNILQLDFTYNSYHGRAEATVSGFVFLRFPIIPISIAIKEKKLAVVVLPAVEGVALDHAIVAQAFC